MSRYTPWFNAQKHPPVNGGMLDDYDWRCKVRPHLGVERRFKANIANAGQHCKHCEWRGLTRAAYLKAGGK